MNTRSSLDNISSIQNRKIFFDANILIYIFWPTHQHPYEEKYSNYFSHVLKNKVNLNCSFSTDFIVISEICNRIIKIEYDNYLKNVNLSKENLPFKTFRNKKEGKDTLKEIYSIIKNKILRNFTIIGKAFLKEDIEKCLCFDSLDFCDRAISQLCRENNCILLTNDIDFASTDLDIISSNPRILSN